VNNNGRIILFDEFILDLARGCVVRAGEPVHLRPQTYEVLKYLVESRGHLISKDKLIEEVWKGRAVTDGSLGKCIEEVREALGPEAKEYVRNVRGRGYIFDTGIDEWEAGETISARSEQIDVVRVVVHDEETDVEPIAPTKSPAAIPAPRSAIRVTTATLIVAALFVVVATAFGIYWLITQRQPRDRAVAAVPFREMDISRLTTSGKIKHAAISPDGKYVAQVTEDAEGDSLWVRHVAAPSNVRLAGPAVTEYISVTFAPDGESVYYLTLDRDKGETTLYRVPVLGGPSRMAAYDVGPVGFSPDRKQMAFVRMYRGGESRLIVAGADGTNGRTLATRRPPDFFRMEWNAPAWSPDGKTIACPIRLNDERGHYETVVSVSVDERAESPLTSARWNYVGQPVWLADGSGLLVTASESATAAEQIWHVRFKSGEATRVTHDLNDYHDLSLTADSSRLAAVQDHSISSIWVARGGDAAHASQVSSEVGWLEVVAWTSDGRIVYPSNAGGSGADIWIMDADGSNPKQLTVGARASRGLAVTPDGRHIIFVSDRSGHFNIWRVDSDGGNLRQLTGGDGEFYPHCTPDSQWVVYQRGEYDPTLWKVPTDGGEPVQVTESRASRPAVSPDGELIAYYYLDPDLSKLAWGIGIVSSKGGQRLKRFNFPPTVAHRFVRWSPDGQSIAYPNSPGGVSDIWLQPLDGSPPKQLTGFKAERILAFDWSRDGRSLVVVRGVETRDVVLIGNPALK
jgi:Tol biopolymer transport system component/DNA-binding winged helix-turn-helix (wHTH) protein